MAVDRQLGTATIPSPPSSLNDGGPATSYRDDPGIIFDWGDDTAVGDNKHDKEDEQEERTTPQPAAVATSCGLDLPGRTQSVIRSEAMSGGIGRRRMRWA